MDASGRFGCAVYPEYQVDPSDSAAELTFISAANRNDIRNRSPRAFTFGSPQIYAHLQGLVGIVTLLSFYIYLTSVNTGFNTDFPNFT